MDLERFLLDSSFSNNLLKIEELYEEIYSDAVHTGHPMELYRYVDLQMGNKYQIFAISDLHADVRRFLEVLKRAEFINPDVDMANPIKNLVWNPKMQDKIIVICGDIIDGKRRMDNDMLTNCDELLIHMLIFNLRILARAHNSYVFCTMGNHDFFAFHASRRTGSKLMYKDYIDSRSLDFYESRMDKLLENTLTDDEVLYVERKCEKMDLIYMYRTYLLSRFYLIGFPSFLKINKTLFAHAGFHFNQNIFSYFEESSINSQSLQPHFVNRNILEKLSVLDNLVEYLKINIKLRKHISYSDLYNEMTDKLFPLFQKIGQASSKNVISPYTDIMDRHSMFQDLFLTRELQQDCGAVDNILSMYGCNSLVVGHCPTCSFDVFNPRNVDGITNCNDARIVYSCNNNLVTVDIAMSSAFSPDKEFLEMLQITNLDDTVQKVCTIRYHLKSDTVILYNEKLFDGSEWVDISGLP